ncbi:hypothetical protein D0Z07_2742 [Hyphodiscus hymeniophilus]|uniref:Uncharacterized protein n=1 Tax=Hyphodiscus hymeniophilus TaxID=353542 RepID=A0A9P6VNK2_9HELO|nr:hypothetical protein D0Z07_2742 [Hyphodiscus hymeniophilus]
MSLTIRSLNSDASFLLTFRPILPFPPSPGQAKNEFTVVLDPWLSGASKIWHPKFSISRHKQEACISTLNDLPEPDLVIISQSKTDHCHQETLTQLPRSGGKTLILAEPAAAKMIKGWKHFDSSKLITLSKWEDSRTRPNPTVHRIDLPALTPSGLPGEVTITFIPQKPDLTGLHNAIGITYRPPTFSHLEALPDSPPDTPNSFQSTFSHAVTDRALSVIFSPHGCNYKTLVPYVTSHLISEAALPLTALLHCFDRVQNSWYMGGNICAGLPGGSEIAQNLCAKAWISAHDSDKDSSGLANLKIKIEKFAREEVEAVVSPRSEKFPDRRIGTEAVILESGEEITLSGSMDFGRDEVEKIESVERSESSTLVEAVYQKEPVEKYVGRAESLDSGIAS